MKTRLSTAAVVVAGSIAALTLTAPDLASAVTPRPHPPITDVSGDAPNPVGMNVASADLLSADLTLTGRVLTAVVTTGASATGGSGPSNDFDRAPYALMGVFGNPNGQAIPVRITLDPGGRGVLLLSEEVSYEGATTSSGGVTRVRFTVPRNASPYLTQGVTGRTAAKGFAAFADVRSAVGRAADRTDNVDFTLGG